MREIAYQKFSLFTHQKNLKANRPNSCHFELTFKCAFHCRYCYSQGFNNLKSISQELTTQEAKLILDKIAGAGILWLCFTGGDPLERRDFLEIYDFAKSKGFLITIFTNGYSLTKRIVSKLIQKPPFSIEITLNAATKGLYEEISGIAGSFQKVMRSIACMRKAGLPLKIKTQMTQQNFHELSLIKGLLAKWRLGFNPSPVLHAGLDGSLVPCNLRISAQETARFFKKDHPGRDNFDCKQKADENPGLFPCAIDASDGINIDPCGNMFPCICIRGEKINLLNKEITAAQKEIISWVKNKQKSIKKQECRGCRLRFICLNCPGYAWLENCDMGEKIEWFCSLARSVAGQKPSLNQ